MTRFLGRGCERRGWAGDSRTSVVEGVSSTASVITAAALIMVAVFASFMLVDDPVVKMMGLGLATAVLIDATVIRMITVPASMELLGDTNWWLPRSLQRLLPHLDLEGGHPEPQTADMPDHTPGVPAAEPDPASSDPVAAR